MTATSPPTVVIADNDAGVRRALSELIIAHPGLILIGVADSGVEAVELCERHRPTVAAVDVMMRGGGSQAIAAIRLASPGTAVVVYTAQSGRRTKERLRAAGAAAIVVKGGHVDIASTLVAVAFGRPTFWVETEGVDD